MIGERGSFEKVELRNGRNDFWGLIRRGTMFKRLAAITIAVTILGATPAYAGQWMQDSAGWWWQNDDGSYPTSEWRWLDGNNDGVSEKYYFGADGYMLSNGAAPDGQLVDGSGAGLKTGLCRRRRRNGA